jgi:hypothetical protein
MERSMTRGVMFAVFAQHDQVFHTTCVLDDEKIVDLVSLQIAATEELREDVFRRNTGVVLASLVALIEPRRLLNWDTKRNVWKDAACGRIL